MSFSIKGQPRAMQSQILTNFGLSYSKTGVNLSKQVYLTGKSSLVNFEIFQENPTFNVDNIIYITNSLIVVSVVLLFHNFFLWHTCRPTFSSFYFSDINEYVFV